LLDQLLTPALRLETKQTQSPRPRPDLRF